MISDRGSAPERYQSMHRLSMDGLSCYFVEDCIKSRTKGLRCQAYNNVVSTSSKLVTATSIVAQKSTRATESAGNDCPSLYQNDSLKNI